MKTKPKAEVVEKVEPLSKLPGAKKTEASSRKTAPVAKKEKPRCELCGHWSTATEYGVDERSGYCDHWEKLTARDFWCDEFVSQEKFKALQSQLAEDNEEYLDEET